MPLSSSPPPHASDSESEPHVGTPAIVLEERYEHDPEDGVVNEDIDSEAWPGFDSDAAPEDYDASDSSPSEPEIDKPIFDIHPTAGATFGTTRNILEEIETNDKYSKEREENTYYPFASEAEFQVAAYLDSSSLSMGEIDKFLKLELVSCVAELT